MSGGHLEWEDAGTGEPGDQIADSGLVAHGYWETGPQGLYHWSMELIENSPGGDQIASGGVHLGSLFPSESAAKSAAQEYEDTHQRGIPGVEPPLRGSS